jgi:methylenetetrahydrofolate dehydrogenase (NADP+) / methenyltetrahydrofolate cyclohydrolase
MIGSEKKEYSMIIDGKKIASEIQAEIQATIIDLKHRAPCLAVILVGDHPASKIYIHRKSQACAEVGIKSVQYRFPSDITEESLLQKIDALNKDPTIDGLLIQLPLPSSINPNRVMHHIHPDKDVDGFHPLNIGKMLMGEKDGFFPCTPLGIKTLLERSNIEIAGKHVLILGRSNIVGKPLAALLMQNSLGGNATVTVAHSQSNNITALSLQADVIVAAIGQPNFVLAPMVKEGAIIIDVGINKIDDPTKKCGYRIVGDVDFDNVYSKCSHITPVPGGVGPMTIAMLLQNTLKSCLKKFHA